MRVVVDALGAPATSGGMRLYAEEMLRAWVEAYPGDDLVVVGYPWVAALALPGVRVHERPEGARSRIVGQWVSAGLVARREHADALVSVSTVVSPLFPRERRVCTVHDWRHRLRPEEFSRAQRLYRRGWDWSVAHAGHAVQISAKTLAETERFVPRGRPVLVPNGRDHARRWPVPSPSGPVLDCLPDAAPYVLSFGHLANKRPELVIEALARPEVPSEVHLVVVGARGEHADGLAELARRLGVRARVDLPGFVADPVYQALVRGAATVVMASSDEGFGLPVVEAGWFGVPVVVTDDSGLPEIHGDRVRASAATPQALGVALAAAVASAPDGVRAGSAPGADPGGSASPGWQDTVSGVRRILVG